MTSDNLISVLKAFGELSSEGVMLFCVADSRTEYVNNALARMFDITHSSFHSEPAFFVNHILAEDVDYLKRQREKLMDERCAEDVEFRVRGHGGDVKLLSASAYLVENGQFVIGIFKDITERREHEAYITNYGAKKNTLLEMVTNNLSAPLVISQNMIQSMERLISEKNLEDIGVHVQLIKENTRHCIEVVTDFLEEEHLASEQVVVRRNRIELMSKINTILERFQKGYPEFDFLFLKEKPSLYINTDDVKLLQVVNNLISNAIKWSSVGSVIEVRVSDEERSARISIRDHGVGIPDDLKPFIFERHSRAKRNGLRGEVSSGVGLHMVRNLVTMMGGQIGFESSEGNGALFFVELPLE